MKQVLPTKMRSKFAHLLALLLFAGIIAFSLAESYDCTIEKDGELDVCVFRNVTYFKNTTHIAFYSPSSSKPENVAFRDSRMVAIPPNFLTSFADGLKVLKVENCGLETVTITKNMVALHAKGNNIQKVLLYRNHQCENLMELDLSSNALNTVDNVTSCVKLETLNLSENENIWGGNTLDLTLFARLTQLQDLNLAGTGALYIENDRNIGLPLLKTMDLSKNFILPVDFSIKVFYPFTALESLKLNDNDLGSIDYAHLLHIKSLKTVYLNGNSFQCRKIKEMLDYLNDHNIATPTDRHSNCRQNAREVEEMCCTGPMPTRPTTTTTTTTTTPSSHSVSTESGSNTDNSGGDGKADENTGSNNGDGTSHHYWIIGAVVGVIVAAAVAGGAYWYKRRQNN
ncbi:uncharacterized protein LOC109621313 [Aedes albopictus]|uniref:Mitotic protein phosphatase 1 regulator n=1 Tax=Aedes albopictus TaxID=7160 RepID=A0ABM1Y1F1_AEDAL